MTKNAIAPIILACFFVDLSSCFSSSSIAFNKEALLLQASETAYHQLVNHGYLKYVPNGAVIVFGIGLAGLLHLYCKDKLHTNLRKSIEYVLFIKWILHISALTVVVSEPTYDVLRDVCCSISAVKCQVRSPAMFNNFN